MFAVVAKIFLCLDPLFYVMKFFQQKIFIFNFKGNKKYLNKFNILIFNLKIKITLVLLKF
jgi:hypothetical protein